MAYRRWLFESYVIIAGNETFSSSRTQDILFESYVIIAGNETQVDDVLVGEPFESYVIIAGNETENPIPWAVQRLRAM